MFDERDRPGSRVASAPALPPDELAAMLPGSDLAAVLERGLGEDAEDAVLVEAVAAWQRVAAWAAAGAARAAADLAERPSMNPVWPPSAGGVSELNVAGEELAMRLGCSRIAARALVRDGRAFLGTMAATGDALARGEIDLPRARVVVRALEDVPVPLALEVQDRVLPRAARRTCTQVGQDVARALIAVDPDGARVRHEVAVRRRRLDRPRALPDGMAAVSAVLPAADAVRLDAGIDHLARSARTAGDARTLDQLRADILVDLTVGVLDPAGAGVLDPAQVEALDPMQAVHRDMSERPGPAGEPGRVSSFARAPRPRAQIRVTVSLASLLGVAGAPAELAGYGPITAEVAQALARGGTWRRIVLDPVTDTVLNVGRTRYRPPADLAEHVRARDATCVRAGCSAPADGCDLDHTIEYRHDGETRAENLAPLCPRDHAVKTDGGFRLSQVAPGVFEWLTPAGLRHRVEPGRAVVRDRDGVPPF